MNEDISVLDLLANAGITDVKLAAKRISDLAGRGITDDDVSQIIPNLLTALTNSPDADRSLQALSKWWWTLNNPRTYLEVLQFHPVFLDTFCFITGSSQLFADQIARQPELVELIADPGSHRLVFSSAQYLQDLHTLLASCRSIELKREALALWKIREMLRTGVRDLLGIVNMPQTAKEFSHQADACVQGAFEIAVESAGLNSSTVQLAVIGLGKLGGQELNYSSDIDLIFVHADNLSEKLHPQHGSEIDTDTALRKVAENLVRILTDSSSPGQIFRVDLRLRPEGRFGPLVRSISSYDAYYESWAEDWERQAMIKSRFIAGDRLTGSMFLEMMAPHVFYRHIPASFITHMGENKQRIENKAKVEGEWETNIKTGYGSIRDVEFIVQLLQLLYGSSSPRLRTPSTLTALNALRHQGLISRQDYTKLEETYIFLRDLEHRLQLLHGHQTQILPLQTDIGERSKLAKRMRFSDLAAFEIQLQRYRDEVHDLLNRLFYKRLGITESSPATGPSSWYEVLDNIDTPSARSMLCSQLSEMGFDSPEEVLDHLKLEISGNQFGATSPDTRAIFLKLSSQLISLAADSPDPSSAITGFINLANSNPNRTTFYSACYDSEQLTRKLVSFAGSSPHLMVKLVRKPDWLEYLVNPETDPYTIADAPKYTPNQRDAWIKRLADWYVRAQISIASRDIWREVTGETVRSLISQLAEATIHKMAEAVGNTSIAYLGMGKLGGREMNYASDWDLILVCEDPTQSQAAEQSAADFLSLAHALQLAGAPIMVDLRLRPWGKDGALAPSLSGINEYFRTSAETWERQAALKSRFISGNRNVGIAAEEKYRTISSGTMLSNREDEEIHAMKVRMENDRVLPENRDFDLKLGWGGLSDIEWLVQRFQLRHGSSIPALSTQGTISAISVLANHGLLSNPEADILIEGYTTLSSTRNAIWLYTGTVSDILPSDHRTLRAIAGILGYNGGADNGITEMRDGLYRLKKSIRDIFVYRFQTI